MSEASQQSPGNGDKPKLENKKDEQNKERESAFEKYKSPNSLKKKSCMIALENKKKDALDVNVSPLCRDMFQHIKQMSHWLKDPKRGYEFASPDTPNKIAMSISPAQNDSFLAFQKDDFQLKNESAQKHLKISEFHYPETLLSKSDSSKKIHIKKIINDHDMENEGCLKRRLFEKESSEYEVEENSNYNILSYNENIGIVDKLITPPPKTTRRIQNVLSDQKQSGVKYFQNESLEKIQQIDPNNPYYNIPAMSAHCVPQVIYKSHKYKQTSYPYLIPFCNKCNLPPILPIHPDFEMEMIPPTPSQPAPAPIATEREILSPQPPSTPLVKCRNKARPKKKPSVDDQGKRIIRRRKRKTYEQIQTLIQEFQNNPEWSKDNMQEVSRKTGLSEAQVYKWGWDQKRKMQDPTHDLHAELRMYKKQQDEEEEQERNAIRRLKLSSSLEKTKRHSDEFQVPKDKISIKTRSAIGEPKDDFSWNKENENSVNKSHKPETRGVKRKLKAISINQIDN